MHEMRRSERTKSKKMSQVPLKATKTQSTRTQKVSTTRENLITLLEKRGFSCFVSLEKRSCFDIAARKGQLLLLIKIMPNIDSLHEDQAEELRSLAYSLNGKALVVGQKSKSYELMDGVIYERYKIKTLNAKTLEMSLGEEKPTKKCYKGRLIAELDQHALEKKLEEVNIAELAKKMNLSRRAIYQYRDGAGIEFEKAKKLEELLDIELIKPQKVFSDPVPPAPQALIDYLKKLQELGFQVTPVHRGFDALASERESLVIDETDEKHAKQKTLFMKDLGTFFKSHPVFVIEKAKKKNLKGIPVISKKEIKETKSAGEIIDKTKDREK